MKTRIAFLAAILLIASPILLATNLDQQTLDAWDKYVQATNLQMAQRSAGTSPFLWIDEAPGRRERVRQGEILAEPVRKNGPEKVPHGLIHHWIGSVFIPNATIKSVYTVLHDYPQYKKFYNPAVVDAQLLSDADQKQSFSMELAEKMPFVTAAIESEYLAETVRLDEHHSYTIISSTRIQQIEDYGRSGQHALPPDKGTGYIWRLYAIQRFEERDGGVYAECEVIALSRDVPLKLEWLVKPILQHLPRNAMQAVLYKTREAVCAETALEVANGRRT
jgi:hypothetical protein